VGPNVWTLPGILLFYGSNFTAEWHRHNALQIVWPAKLGLTDVEGQQHEGALLLAAEVEHQLSMEEGWVMLVEPQSTLGVALAEFLSGEPARPIDKLESFCSQEQGDIQQSAFPRDQLVPLFKALGIEWGIEWGIKLGGGNDFLASGGGSLDKRIHQLVQKLNACFGADCLKPDAWRAAEVASELALSESRFLHLFRREMNIAWRPYLLWRRLQCAVEEIHRGGTATEAAYHTGFSDSAHLSRTFRSQFGMTLRDAKSIFR